MVLPERGTYALLVRVREGAEVTIGSLGDVPVEPGVWVYVGSGMGSGPTGLKGRLKRHLETADAGRDVKHWHIDHLLDALKPEILGAWVLEGSKECLLARAVGEVAEGKIPGFGCTDCDCETHLFKADLPDTVKAVSEVGGGIYLPRPNLLRWVSSR